MGLPAGWVTDVPGLPRNAQLKALGNGVVPQQAALALHLLGVTPAAEVAAWTPQVRRQAVDSPCTEPFPL